METSSRADLIEQAVRSLRVRYGRTHRAFIDTHARRLLIQGDRFIQHAYRTKTRTVIEHDIKLAVAREEAGMVPGPERIGLVRYYEKELERLRSEHTILRDAMEMMEIPVP